ncbi:MAG: AAA family ATPase [Nitrosomonadales bacterium]|nr:AAA family ATPase [Nitrosomonadales bacterium]
MLRRISTIQNIGRFKKCSAGAAQFEKITLIFGRNTYGKSTLADLFSSLETGVVDFIARRRTIPDDNQPQKATLSFQADGQQNEIPINLSLPLNDGWNPDLPNGLSLHVFDDGFLHKNVFAARLLTRSTKERFSAFVLGAQGVAKALDIADKNKQKGDATRERNKLYSAALKGIDDLPEFLKLSPTESVDAINEKILALRRDYDALNKQRTNAARIQARKELDALSWEVDFSGILLRLNQVLQASLQTFHEGARLSVAKHIQQNFADHKSAESWIQQGLTQNNGVACQFCGQTLTKEALQLLEIYRQSFDTSYREHEQRVRQELIEIRTLLNEERINILKIAIESNNSALVGYTELEDDGQYLRLKERLSHLTNDLNNVLDAWKQRQPQFGTRLGEVINQKLASPHMSFNEFQDGALIDAALQISKLVTQYNADAIQLNAIYRNFKSSVQYDSLTQRLAEIERDGKTESRKLKRVELSDQCAEYLALELVVKRLGEEIAKLNEELRTEQSEFLEQFFTRMNIYFRLFGSENFQLEKGEDKSGHTPVYFLKVKFHGIDVSERNLEHVFSESDRRALALSIFWSSLSGLSDIEMRNAIVVLDDPVTSFDNHRMTSMHQEIVRLADSVRQIIVLSHFEHGISYFLNTYRHNKVIQLLSIERVNDSSNLVVSDIDCFIKTEHEKARDRIFRFASGQTNAHNPGELRTFFEYEVSHRFAKQIYLNNISVQNFSDRIDKLMEVGAITAEIAKVAHEWREVLNPTHHIWTGSDIEDQRNTASRFRDFIYHDLVPA